MVLLFMIFFHILDDWVLQGKLGQMKQKNWWKEHPEYQDMYKYDYIVALLTHSFSWTFMIMLPVSYVFDWKISVGFIIVFCINMVIHAVVDDLKANRKKINLVVDQVIHLIQIVATYIVMMIIV
jgi:hypothetical protein